MTTDNYVPTPDEIWWAYNTPGVTEIPGTGIPTGPEGEDALYALLKANGMYRTDDGIIRYVDEDLKDFGELNTSFPDQWLS